MDGLKICGWSLLEKLNLYATAKGVTAVTRVT
jgi:hypothetical protein